MIIEIYEEAKKACDAIECLALAVLAGADRGEAEKLIGLCKGTMGRLAPRFGYVREKIAGVATEARRFTRVSCNITEAAPCLQRAVTEMRSAIRTMGMGKR